MKTHRLIPSFVVILVTLITTPLFAWHDEGHYYIALAAAEAQTQDGPQALPAFFREGAKTIAHLSLDPDLHCERAIAASRDAEASDHYLDLELMQGQTLATTRSGHVQACQALGLEYNKVGTLPWKIMEETQRLALAFAEHRRWPDNPHIQQKILVYAGMLAHYSADLHMPLHTSIHFNGRAPQTGKTFGPSPSSGIHAKVDALPTHLPYNTIFQSPVDTSTNPPANSPDLWAYILDQMAQSHALVDTVYAMEANLPAAGTTTPLPPKLQAFTIERTRAGAAMTATLYRSAWVMSASMQVPNWLDRAVFDDTLNRDEVPDQPGN